jgi:hypothetical protein
MRISKKDKAEYNRLKNNVKSKIKRVQKKDQLDLSGLIELPPLESFTRKDFNIWKEKAKKFSSRGNRVLHNEYGVPYTKQLEREYQSRAEKANEIKDKFNEVFKDKPFLSGGKETGITVGQRDFLMKNPDDVGNRTKQQFDIHKIRDMRGLQRKMKRIDEEQDIEYYNETLSQMQLNWIEAVKKAFNSDGDAIIEKVKQLDPAVFYELYKSNDDMDFDFIYDEADNETVMLLAGMMDDVIKGNIPMLLKDFPDRW